MPTLVDRVSNNELSSSDKEEEKYEYYDSDKTEATSALTDVEDIFDSDIEETEGLVDLTLYDSEEETIVDLTQD